jgi:hypothetical protein
MSRPSRPTATKTFALAVSIPFAACATNYDGPGGALSDGQDGAIGIPAAEGGAGAPDGDRGSDAGSLGQGGDAGAPPFALRVAAGATSPYTDSTGHVWSADTGFTGGVAGDNQGQAVQGAADSTLYDGQRYGNAAGFAYDFPVPAGSYEVTLKFAENYVNGVGQRLFGVSIDGTSVLSDFDIYAESGGPWRALDKTFPVTLSAAGSIDIQFSVGSIQMPKVDAIAIASTGSPGDAGSKGPDASQQPDAGNMAGVGPTSTSNFVVADFTNSTSPAGVPNVVVAPQLFGAATGGLANAGFGALSNPTTAGLIKALDLPLLRLNSNFANPQTSAAITPLVQHALDVFPNTCTWVIGVDDASSATDVASYVKANSPIDCKLWEVHNEAQPGESSSSYDSDALAIAQAVKAVDPSYRIAGDVSAGLDIGDLQALVAATDSTTLGLLDFHDYLYCANGNNAPSDSDVCLANRGGSNAYAQDQQAIQSAMQGTFAASLPVLLGEYNIECSASFSDLRAGTSVGAAFMVSSTLGTAAASTQPVWSAVWDLIDDGGANYNLIDGSNNTYPQYYTLQRLIATMPGDMVNTAEGAMAGGVQSWATKNGAAFGLAIVNSNASSVTGTVALSHWPVNNSGNGAVTVWTYPQVGDIQHPVTNTPGTTSKVNVSAGVTDPITVPGSSVAIVSSP